VTLLQMDGQITQEEFARSIDMLKKGCLEVYRLQRDAIEAHFKVSESSNEEA